MTNQYTVNDVAHGICNLVHTKLKRGSDMPSKQLILRWDNDAGYEGMYGAFVDSEGTAWNQAYFYDEEITCFICGKSIMDNGYQADGIDDYMEMCESHAVIKGRAHLSKHARY